jgi:putative membrane protein
VRISRSLPVACLLWTCSTAVAHTVSNTAQSSPTLGEWLEVGLPLLIAATLYIRGTWTLGQRSAWGHQRRWMPALAFAGGWLALALALLSPLDRWGTELFAAHMIQHEVLMLVAAPLLVLGRPLPVFLWALADGPRATLGRSGQRGWFSSTWKLLTQPLTAWLLHALALWIWHAPPLFNAVLVNRGVHDLQHITFLFTALLFWSALLHARAREMQGAAIIYLFTTTVHSSVLGALITFGSKPWYQSYLQTAPHWGLSALEDQQLGGLIMWVPASFVYIGIALVLLARWIQRSGQATGAGAERRYGWSTQSGTHFAACLANPQGARAMSNEELRRRKASEQAGGQHGTKNTGGSASDVGSRPREQPSKDPQLRKVHESAGSDDELGRGNDTSLEQGGSRHRTQ